MSYRCDIAATMLEKDYEELKKRDSKSREILNLSVNFHKRTIRGVKTVTLMWEFVKYMEWEDAIMDFFDNESVCKRPYRILVIGEDLTDCEHSEQLIDYCGEDGPDHIPYEACPYIRRTFSFDY